MIVKRYKETARLVDARERAGRLIASSISLCESGVLTTHFDSRTLAASQSALGSPPFSCDRRSICHGFGDRSVHVVLDLLARNVCPN